ncbi:MAG: hypothetical protein JW902_07390 [Syntrophaceae bacterium]|nr:hypothetical protein [Syntrophaceae bacterium]
MKRYLNIIFLALFLLSGCSNVPSTEEINGDITTLETEIKDANATVQHYSGGLLYILANVRLETLKTTKTMLEQKRSGLRRYIPLSYSIDGKKYTVPANKDELLQELNDDLENLQQDLSKAEMESSKYGGGLLGLLSLVQVSTVENSIAFLNQRRLLLKHDIPYYSIVTAPSGSLEPSFKPTPGEDINKF